MHAEGELDCSAAAAEEVEGQEADDGVSAVGDHEVLPARVLQLRLLQPGAESVGQVVHTWVAGQDVVDKCVDIISVLTTPQILVTGQTQNIIMVRNLRYQQWLGASECIVDSMVYCKGRTLALRKLNLVPIFILKY